MTSIHVTYKIFEEKSGDYITVGEDDDGLGLIKISCPETGVDIFISKEMADSVIKAMSLLIPMIKD